jgi:hypothetical protein
VIVRNVVPPVARAKTAPGKPKLNMTVDLTGSVSQIQWTAPGTEVLVSQFRAVEMANGKRESEWSVVLLGAIDAKLIAETTFGTHERFLSVSPDGKNLLVDRSDAAKVSGFHRVELWTLQEHQPNAVPRFGGPGRQSRYAYVSTGRSLEVDMDETIQGRFTADGSRVVLARSRTVGDQATDVRLWEWNLSTPDETGKQLLAIDGRFVSATLSPYRPEVLTVDTGARWTWHSADPDRPTVSLDLRSEVRDAYRNPGQGLTLSAVFSPDGKQAVVNDTNRGTPVRTFNLHRVGGELKFNYLESSVVAQGGTYSADGSLFCATAFPAIQERRGSDGGALTVWRMTGDSGHAVVKRWAGPAVSAFSPKAPFLATAEPLENDRWRVGFWHFPGR